MGVSLTIPRPLVDVLKQLDSAGVIDSSSAAASTAIEQWLRRLMIRLTLDEVYEEDPDLRPDQDAIAAMAEEIGLNPL